MDHSQGRSDIGNLHGFLENYLDGRAYEYSYLSGRWADHEQWRAVAKAKVFELMGYFPEPAPLEAETVRTIARDGYTQHEVRFNTARNVRVQGSLLVPSAGKGPFPAVVALHDHGGFYYFGREKILESDVEPQALADFKLNAYSGRSWASDLARRGYIVLAIDAFYFGSRKPDLNSVSDYITERYRLTELDGLVPGSSEYILKFNYLCIGFEGLFVRHALMAGTTWPGILYHDDRRSVDFLLTRPEVDPERIGCCGLSLGGIRSVHLAGLDARIKASVAAGWMTTSAALQFNRLRDHTYMLYVPRMTAFLDIPDVASLAAPNAMFIQQCTQDLLYNMEGMQEAAAKIEAVYAALGIPGKYRSQFYDNGHEFNLSMQRDAFEWLDKWLKPRGGQ